MPKPLDEDEYTPDEDETPPAIPSRRPRSSAPVEDDEETPRTPKSSPSGLRRGWSAGQQTMDANSDYAQALKVEGNIQIIKFLEDEPYVSYTRHWLERTNAEGKRVKRPYVCLQSVGKSCPLCDDLGDRPQAVSSFNVALIGDDGVPTLKTWDVGSRLFGTIRSFQNDPKLAPITKGFWAVSKTGKGGNSQTNVIPVKSAASLLEDYGVEAPSEDALKVIGLYDANVIQIPKVNDLREIAAELAGEDDY